MKGAEQVEPLLRISQKELLGLSTPGSQNSPENKKGLPSSVAFFVCARFAVA